MKELNQALLEELEQLAVMGCQAMRAALTDHNDNPMTYRKAKVGSKAVTNFISARTAEGTRLGMEAMAALRRPPSLSEALKSADFSAKPKDEKAGA
jgi:hypothetical protein